MLIGTLVCAAVSGPGPCQTAGTALTDGPVAPGLGRAATAAAKEMADQDVTPNQQAAESAPSAADAPLDQNQPSEPPERGVRFVWGQHPSLRFGSLFRIDFQARSRETSAGRIPGRYRGRRSSCIEAASGFKGACSDTSSTRSSAS